MPLNFTRNRHRTTGVEGWRGDNKLYNSNVIGSGKTVAIRIEENSTNASFRLDTAVLEYGVETRQ